MLVEIKIVGKSTLKNGEVMGAEYDQNTLYISVWQLQIKPFPKGGRREEGKE